MGTANWEEMIKNGYVDGSRPGAPVTREEVAVMMNRLRKNFLTLIVGCNEQISEVKSN